MVKTSILPYFSTFKGEKQPENMGPEGQDFRL